MEDRHRHARVPVLNISVTCIDKYRFVISQEPVKEEPASKRHPTWSNATLNLLDRPRSRSFSVTRSTQTQKDVNFLVRNEPTKTITFQAPKNSFSKPYFPDRQKVLDTTFFK